MKRHPASLSFVATCTLPLVLASAACGDSKFTDSEVPSAATEDAGAAAPVAESDAATARPDAEVINSAPPGCDGTKLPTQDPCVVDDGLGVFVSIALGPPAGDGTKARPVNTIQKGIDLAKPNKKRVYVCAETFTENLVLADGVSLFGYFDCKNAWTVVPAKRAHVDGKTVGAPVIKAASIASKVRIEGFDVVAPAGSAAAKNSIALLASSATLDIVDSSLKAGAAANGANGTPGVQLSNGASLNGDSHQGASFCSPAANQNVCRVLAFGGSGGTNTCVGASGFAGLPGGHGGYGGKYTRSGSVISQVEAREAGEGGTLGVAGGDGPPGAAGGNGASSQAGTFDSNGFTPGNGGAGANGAPGFGGAGGSGRAVTLAETNTDGVWFGASGTGGGAGGCPGLAGTAGTGGGASVAVVSWLSTLALTKTTVVAGVGGAAGAGTFGSAPTLGGNFGPVVVVCFECPAGKGGKGGESGVSGHGAPGPSIGVAFKGTAPQIDAATKTTVATAQLAQPIQTSGSKVIPASGAGIAQALYAIP